MESQSELVRSDIAKAKWLLISLGLLILSGVGTWVELVFLFSGRDGEGDVTKVTEVTRKTRLGLTVSKSLEVEFTFTEPDGTRRTGRGSMSADNPVPRSRTAIRYTPGADGRARLSGETSWLWLIIFLVCLSSVIYFSYRAIRELNEAVSDLNRARGKR